jgi:hypothetical protein
MPKAKKVETSSFMMINISEPGILKTWGLDKAKKGDVYALVVEKVAKHKVALNFKKLK